MITADDLTNRIAQWPDGELDPKVHHAYRSDGGWYGIIEHLLWGEANNRITFHDLTITLADHRTGREGDWHKAVYLVLRVDTNDGQTAYFRQDGTYASHAGTEWEGHLYQVTPATETVNIWAPKW
ncbi:hypothetical protein IU485_27755 [Nocardia cyriacigeorgica]|uniref:hypothetical protein n=1 Tax=Nocardia cyriacigeorgica TaxID=135487 RepID=UPI001895DB7F|nr:hypothetical protein [Nocardia cyriacigeorgica]MBF6085173.1 hypothetical protein [Nocardia cyriacigeorgica]